MRVVRFFQWMFLALLLGTVIALFGLHFPIFQKSQPIVISSQEGQEIYGGWYEGTRDLGVMIVGNPDEDLSALKSIAQEFYNSGAHVLTLDYSGHGFAGSKLEKDWLESDGLSGSLSNALDIFQRQSRLEPQQILVIGHGIGGRNLLKWIAEQKPEIRGVVLVSPDLSLGEQPNPSPYLQPRDDRSGGWTAALNTSSISVPLALIGIEQDEVVPPDSVGALYQKLTASSALPALGTGDGISSVSSGNVTYSLIAAQTALSEDATIVDQLLNPFLSFDRSVSQHHSFQMQTNTVSVAVKDWARSKANMRSVSSTTIFPMIRLICWLLAAVSLLGVSLFSMILTWNRYPSPESEGCGISVYPWRALLIRLGLWLPAAIVALLLWLVLWLLPLGDALEVSAPVVMMGGYGIVTLVLYGFRLMPGSRGCLQLLGEPLSFWRSTTIVLLTVSLVAYLAFLGYSGLHIPQLSGASFGWIFVLTVMLAIGFLAAELECDILTDNGGGFAVCMLYRCIRIVPVILFCLWFDSVLGMQNIVSIVVAFQLSGAFRRHCGGRMIPALACALLFCLMMVPSTVITA